MTYVYEYAEDNPHQRCHKIEITTGNDLRLGRRAYIDQRCDECRAEIDEIEHLRAQVEARGSVISAATDAINHLQNLITEWADAYDNGEADEWHTAGDALRKAVGR